MVDYLAGICREMISPDDTRDAEVEFSKAANAAEATLWTDDGLLVAPFAASRTRRAR